MLSAVLYYLANQARKPSGWFGRIVAPRVFEKTNKHMENFGLKLLDPQPEDEILEIGFGHGRLLSELMPQIEEGTLCGIDISEQMVNAAAKRNREGIQEGKVELQKASIADIPYTGSRFDKVFTCNTIYFWPNPSQDIKEVKRVLKSNGQFFCAFRDKELMESKSSAVTDNRDVFQHLFKPEEVRQLFEKADLRGVQLHNQSANGEEFYIASGRRQG